MKQIVNTFLLIISVSALATGQGYDAGGTYDTLRLEARVELGKEAILTLKDGVLIVRLKWGNKKVQAMEKVANNPDVSAAERERFAARIEKVKKEIQQENEWIVQSFREEYTFSPIYFMPDFAVHSLKEGQQSGYFLNDELAVDPMISLDQRSYLLTYYGLSGAVTKSGIEGLVVLDDQMKELVDPFPHFTGLTTMRRSLSRFFNKTDEVEFYKMMVRRLNERLIDYYEINN